MFYVIHVCVKEGMFNHLSAKIYNHIAVQNILKVRQAYDFIYPARIERIAQLIPALFIDVYNMFPKIACNSLAVKHPLKKTRRHRADGQTGENGDPFF